MQVGCAGHTVACIGRTTPSDAAGASDVGLRAEVEFLATRLQSLEGLGAMLVAMENRPAPPLLRRHL